MHDQEVHDAAAWRWTMQRWIGGVPLGMAHAAMTIRGFLEREHERGDGKWVKPGKEAWLCTSILQLKKISQLKKKG